MGSAAPIRAISAFLPAGAIEFPVTFPHHPPCPRRLRRDQAINCAPTLFPDPWSTAARRRSLFALPSVFHVVWSVPPNMMPFARRIWPRASSFICAQREQKCCASPIQRIVAAWRFEGASD